MDNMCWPGENPTNYAVSGAVGGCNFSQPVGDEATFWGCAKNTESGEGAVDSDDAWAACHAATQERQIMQEDGETMKATKICEFRTIVEGVSHDMKNGPLLNGIWIGGEKHKITNKETIALDDSKHAVLVVSAMRADQKGFEIVCTDANCKGDSLILIAGWDRKAKDPVTAGMARVVALAWADELVKQNAHKGPF